jgi:hypothetical protein
LLHTNADVVGGQNLYTIELIILFDRKTFNSLITEILDTEHVMVLLCPPTTSTFVGLM